MNKHSLSAVMGVLAIVLLSVLVFGLVSGGASAQANETVVEESSSAPSQQTAEKCQVDVSGTIGLVICGGEVVDQLPLPQVTVRGPEITLPPVTVTIPGPESTVTVRPPQATETVTVAPPTVTETLTPPRETVTIRPRPVINTVTVTATPVVQGPVAPTPRQPVPRPDIIGPDTTLPIPPPLIDRVFRNVGIGIAALLGLVAVVLAGMYSGYILGWKDKERKDTNFMRALLEQAALRKGNHS